MTELEREAGNPRLATPVFIVGPLRSGTTMLRLMMDHHPGINIFGEFEYPVIHAGAKVTGTGDWPAVSDYCDRLETDRGFLEANVVADRNLAYPDLVRSFFAQHAARTDKPVVGASVHSRFDLYARLWPRARFVHILRDPRDVARSTIGMGWTGHAYFGAKYWVEPEQRWDLLGHLPSDQRMEVRYEDLVRRPEAELARVCDFLGVGYDQSMLEYDQNSTYSKPDPKLAEQWKRKMSPRDARLVEAACGELLTARGYSPSGSQPLKPSVPERVVLRLRSRINMTAFAVRYLGPSLWVRRFVASRFGSAEWKRKIRLEVNDVEREHVK